MEPRVAFLKPLASAIAIGTGGPFGAEGPIIMTGGALGSILAQHVPLAPRERRAAQGVSVQVWLDAAGEPTVLPGPVRQALETSQQPDAGFVGFPAEGPEAARRPAPAPPPPAGST
jgi:hypothetical protein